MSYLKLPNGVPDFSKAVFSLWFRVPTESALAASSHSLPQGDWPMMQNILPLITFGERQQNKNYQLIHENIVHGAPPENPVELVRPVGWTQAEPYDVNPCCIGLQCYSDGTFDLFVNIQMEDKGSYDSLLWFQTSLDYQGEFPPAPAPGDGSIGDGHYMSTIAEGTYGLQDAQPEWFEVRSDITFEPDKWHHLLLSFDVGGSLSIGNKPSSSCQLWYAIDDVDYRGWGNLGPYRDEDDGLGENIIVTRMIYNESGFDASGPVLFSNHYVPLPSGGYSPAPIPADGAELGLPAASHYVDAIFRVEMAELQIFTGVTLDTGIAGNRAAFVKDGKPVDPTGTQAKPAPAVTLLGKRPEVMLHGNSNWQSGYNTGSLGAEIETDDDGTETIKKLPGGQFTATGGIEKYKPEPSLGETATA
jgi:hypothetical protein